ncbi:universal stress protein [Paenarthrobacter ilicis]|uniref:Nucleotide-binding universal stress UspA family protein n=1 Tax=Paenarthrobacter ilicis TaxID=43665 RepID=A0ABX0TH51_9MICC|nr:nucleotide-binding universal stress UspA family protein [Paenarthrobacter ilicis]NIJ00092.1 nucleotide-binding universal stress UspA family protein [Paenarthrobacter ilicis]
MTHTHAQPAEEWTVTGPILVGVVPGQNPAVVDTAARLAKATGSALVCGYSDVTLYPVDGTTGGPAAPIDPDDGADTDVPGDLSSALTGHLAGSGINWSTVLLAGEPAHALARQAEAMGASMIVVGTRDHTLASAIKEMTAGSVARHLFRCQPRPVLVVPINPRVPSGHHDHL